MEDCEEMLKADGFDDAIVGVVCRAGGMGPVLAYDYDKCVQILMERESWDLEDAVEWMEFNVVCAWVGEGTPVFVYPYAPEGE